MLAAPLGESTTEALRNTEEDGEGGRRRMLKNGEE
jgi:hypothetical protein